MQGAPDDAVGARAELFDELIVGVDDKGVLCTTAAVQNRPERDGPGRGERNRIR